MKVDETHESWSLTSVTIAGRILVPIKLPLLVISLSLWWLDSLILTSAPATCGTIPTTSAPTTDRTPGSGWVTRDQTDSTIRKANAFGSEEDVRRETSSNERLTTARHWNLRDAAVECLAKSFPVTSCRITRPQRSTDLSSQRLASAFDSSCTLWTLTKLSESEIK